MFDIAVLRKAVEWVKDQDARPQSECEWNQAVWRRWWEEEHGRCGTTYCLAGYISEITGGRWVDDVRSDLRDYLVPEPGEEFEMLYDGRRGVLAGHRAARKLGINDTEYDLFAAHLSAEQIRVRAEKIAADHGETL